MHSLSAGLSRDDLVALALLLGCDYCPKGVPGVGRKIALQLLRAWKRCGQSYNLLDRYRRWRSKEFGEGTMNCGIHGGLTTHACTPQ